MKKLYLDLDGVLADFVGGAFKLLDEPVPDDLQWSFLDNKPHVWSRMGFEFWASLGKTPHFNAVVGYASANFNPEDVCVLSSPCQTPGCIEGKVYWIKQHLPWIGKNYLFGSEKHFVSGPDKVLVDDFDKNIVAWRQEGGSAILVPQSWNQLRGQKLVMNAV